MARHQVPDHRGRGRARLRSRQAQRPPRRPARRAAAGYRAGADLLYVERQPQSKIANHAWYTFWYVVPTLPMFLAFPMLLPRLGFWPTLLVCVVITVLCFWLFALLVRRFGIELL